MQSFEKYQKIFLHNISSTLKKWHYHTSIEEREIYKLLHTIKGTGASIGLENLSSEAANSLQSLSSSSRKLWTEHEWAELLQPILLQVETQGEDGDSDRIRQVNGNHVSDQPTILILEDDQGFLHRFKDEMEKYGYNLLLATTEEKALTLFYDEKPNLLIVDYYLNGKNGLEIVDEISNQANSTLTPVIVISADHSKEIALRVYETTAIDFLPKPIDFELLHAIVENRLRHVHSLKKQITTDKLTKVYNRSYLYELLEKKKRAYKRDRQPFCLVILDIDNFKSVNDTYGHVIGDHVLQKLANVLVTQTRPEDVVVRYGGEEFIIVMPLVSQFNAQKRMIEVLNYFHEVPHTSADETFYLSFTAGVAEMHRDIHKMEDLIVQADTALYKGKQSGKSTVINYQEGLELTPMIQENKCVHISVVDDDEIIREMLEERLSELEFYNVPAQVTSYRSGENFLIDQNIHRYKHVVLLDGVLPGKDGLEVLADLREHDQDSIVIMLTARQQGEDIIQALELGADDYMTKPFIMDALIERINRIVRRHKGGRTYETNSSGR